VVVAGGVLQDGGPVCVHGGDGRDTQGKLGSRGGSEVGRCSWCFPSMSWGGSSLAFQAARTKQRSVEVLTGS